MDNFSFYFLAGISYKKRIVIPIIYIIIDYCVRILTLNYQMNNMEQLNTL